MVLSILLAADEDKSAFILGVKIARFQRFPNKVWFFFSRVFGEVDVDMFRKDPHFLIALMLLGIDVHSFKPNTLSISSLASRVSVAETSKMGAASLPALFLDLRI